MSQTRATEDDQPAATGTGPRFGGESCWADLGGPVHYLDYGGPAGAPVIVAVHGLEGSAVPDWSALAPLLTDRYRLLAPDLAGHGFTRSAGRVDVSANRRLLHRFIEAVAGSPVILMGNSMGGMISLSEAAAAPETVAGLILLDPALPFMPVRPDPSVVAMFLVNMIPGVSQRMIRRRRQVSPDELVARVLAMVCADPSGSARRWWSSTSRWRAGGSASVRPTTNSRSPPAPSCLRRGTSPAVPTGGRSAGSGPRSWSCTARWNG